MKQAHGVTFREQAKWWLNHIQRRKRKPLAPATLELWKGCLDNWINPNIGDLPLSEVNNAVLKTLVAKMSEGGLSPKTISDNYVPVVKMVVASAVDEQGEEIYLESGITSSSICPWWKRTSRTRRPFLLRC